MPRQVQKAVSGSFLMFYASNQPVDQSIIAGEAPDFVAFLSVGAADATVIVSFESAPTSPNRRCRMQLKAQGLNHFQNG